MREKTRVFALILALLMAFGLTACGASSEAADAYAGNGKYQTSADMPANEPAMAPMESEIAYDEVVMEEADFIMSTTASTGRTDGAEVATSETPSFAEKIIYSGHASIETTDFDNAIANLEHIVKLYDGFIENANSGGNTRRQNDGTTALVNRWADYTVRIPSQSFDAFMSAANEVIGNVTNSGRSAQNVTSQYTDYEARLESLTIQEDRLLALLEQSGDLESLITLEARLSEVRYEIESIERNLRNLDQRLAYSDVSLYIQEVEIYTPTVPVTRSFGEKLSDAFSDGWTGFTRGLQNFVIGLAEALPTLILWIIIIVVVVIVVIKLNRKRKVRRAAKLAAKAAEAKKEAEE